MWLRPTLYKPWKLAVWLYLGPTALHHSLSSFFCMDNHIITLFYQCISFDAYIYVMSNTMLFVVVFCLLSIQDPHRKKIHKFIYYGLHKTSHNKKLWLDKTVNYVMFYNLHILCDVLQTVWHSWLTAPDWTVTRTTSFL